MAGKSETSIMANELNTFVQKYGLNHLKVFGDLLDFIIAWFDPGKKPIKGWSYNHIQNKSFEQLMHTYLCIMKGKLNTCDWYDAWGNLFMDLIGNFAGYRGQFFTPESLTDTMAELVAHPEETVGNCGAFGMRTIVSDPACGSSRTLLAVHSRMVKSGKPKPYLIGEDLDHLCVKMSAINMCIHGCFGEVICHDSIERPGEVQFGYIINEGMYPFPGLPTIRKYDEPEKFINCRKWSGKQ